MDDPTTFVKSDLEWAIKTVLKKNTNYQIYNNYYDGKHPLQFATDRFRTIFGEQFKAFAANICPAVVDTVVDRLVVTGFSQSRPMSVLEKEAINPSSENLITALTAIWELNLMNRVEGEVYQDSFITGDGYLLVWPDDNNFPELTSQDPMQICVRYAPEDRSVIAMAAKLWQREDYRIRLTLYYPDRVEKYISLQEVKDFSSLDILKADSFEQYMEPDDQSWPIPNPYGQVPIFHFPNNSRIGQFGRSELNNIIPLQDAINKCLTDMLVAEEFAAFPQRYAIGVEFETDPETNQPINPFKSGVERVWTLTDPTGKFGEFGAADLAKFLEVREGFIVDVARISGTPLHYFSGAQHSDRYPSGEALRTAEAPLIAKLRRKQKIFGTIWSEVLQFCMKILEIPVVKVTVVWHEVEAKNSLVFWESLEIQKRLGVSGREILRQAGFSDTQIQTIHQENETDFDYEQKMAPLANIGVNVFDQAKTIQSPNNKP